jgi:hypothetical protein
LLEGGFEDEKLVDLKRLVHEIRRRLMASTASFTVPQPVTRRDDVGIALNCFDDGGTVDAWQPQVGDDDVEGEI